MYFLNFSSFSDMCIRPILSGLTMFFLHFSAFFACFHYNANNLYIHCVMLIYLAEFY